VEKRRFIDHHRAKNGEEIVIECLHFIENSISLFICSPKTRNILIDVFKLIDCTFIELT
jgi:hypothetical protein